MPGYLGSARRDASPKVGRDFEGFDRDAGLAMIVEEIAAMMHATGGMVTLHPASYQLSIIYSHPALAHSRVQEELLAVLASARPDDAEGLPFWRTLDERGMAMLIPVKRVPDHSRLVISLLFDQDNAAVRRDAEEIYRSRTAFAIGYFHLWQVARSLRKRVDALEEVLDQTELGVILVDRGGRVLLTNRTSREMLSTGDGIRLSNGIISATSLGDGVNLQAALAHAVSDDRSIRDSQASRTPLMSFRRKSAPALVASVLPMLEEPLEPNDAAATIYLVDPQLNVAKALTPLCRLYGLSPVETALACHLVAGTTLALAAEKMRIKEQTARSYLKQIFVKTATKRQTEFVVLIFSSLIRIKQSIMQEVLTSANSDRALKSL